MNEKSLQITSAALYFEPRSVQSIPLGCVEAMRRFLGEHGVPMPRFFANGGAFGLEEELDEIVDYDIATRGRELTEALRAGEINRVDLHCREDPVEGPSAPWAVGLVTLANGMFYVEADETTESSPVGLLRRACGIAMEFFDVRYGIAYRMPLADDPTCYAEGMTTDTTTLSEIKRVLVDEESIRSNLKPDAWHDEMSGPRRYLKGFFRGAYPASALSKSHIVGAGLWSANVGRLSPLEERLWCWELSDSEIEIAARILEKREH